MQAIHQPLIPGTGIRHSLFLEHFTPSTIYPYPQPAWIRQYGLSSSGDTDGPKIRIVGNLIVAGGPDLRVFEVREEPVLLDEHDEDVKEAGAAARARVEAEQRIELDVEDDDGFRNIGETDVVQTTERDRTRLRLHIVYQSTLHGIITGLSGIRTMSSLEDGLDRLLVSFKDAKLALLEWSRGEIATVSLHTYERCAQVMYGDVEAHQPRLRTDPNNKLAALSLPSNALAMLPIVQDLLDTEAAEAAYGKDVPYMPSFVLPLEDVSKSLCNVKDFLFLPGFNNPTIAFLYEPRPTWTGRIQTHKDTFHVEVRTLDVLSKTYASLSTVSGLPSDSQYLVACSTAIGGVVVVTSTSIIHVDQSGRKVATSLNGWYGTLTGLSADRTAEDRRFELDGSGAVWMDDKNLLLTLRDGQTFQIKIELEGRAVHTVSILDHDVGSVNAPAGLIKVGEKNIFVASSTGDSNLYRMELEQYKLEIEETSEGDVPDELDMDLDEDLYGDSTIKQSANGSKAQVFETRANLRLCDTLPGFGYIMDACLGIDRSQEDAPVQQLALLHGGERPARFDLCRPGLGLRRGRKLAASSAYHGLWCLRKPALKAHAPPGASFHASGLYLCSEQDSSSLLIQELEGGSFDPVQNFEEKTIGAGAIFAGSSFIRVTPSKMQLIDAAGVVTQVYDEESREDDPFVSATVQEPYIVLRTNTGKVSVYHGDAAAMTLKRLYRPPDGETLDEVLAVCVIGDESGVFRTFDPNTGKQSGPMTAKSQLKSAGSGNRMKLTADQLARLQDAKPSISTRAENDFEASIGINRGSHWLCAITKKGRIEIRSLPDLNLVFDSDSVLDASMALLDDTIQLSTGTEPMSEDGLEEEDEENKVQDIAFAHLGARGAKPHLFILHNNDQLTIYEATPRFTLENLGTDMSRRSLAVRFRKVHAKVVSRGRIPRKIVPWSNAASSGVLVTGTSPFWVTGNEASQIKILPHASPLRSFCDTTPTHAPPNAPNSFALVGTDDIYLAATDVSVDTCLPLASERVQAERSYTHVAFDVRSSCYAGTSALKAPYQLYSDECLIIDDPDLPNLSPPLVERSTLELFNPETWDVVDGYEFEENEVVQCVESMVLGDRLQNKRVLVVGTSVNRGEDMSGRGKIYVFEVVQVVARTDRDDANWGLRLICDDEAKEPVTAIANLGLYLIVAEGQKIYVKALEYELRLVPVAFLDANVYATSIKTLKNLVLIGDMVKSVWFCVFQEDPFKLEVIARDFQDASIVAVDFLSAEGKISFIATDTSGNVRVLEWDPEQAGSVEGGDRLFRRTEYHCGGVITKTLTVARRRPNEDKSGTQTQIAMTNEYGAISTLVPSKAARFKRLQLLQGQLTRSVQHVAGLNPKAFRNVYNPLVPRPPTKTILDGHLLSTYIHLPMSRQRELAEPIGTNRETVLNDLVDLGGFGIFF